jgi:hypothetical protein
LFLIITCSSFDTTLVTEALVLETPTGFPAVSADPLLVPSPAKQRPQISEASKKTKIATLQDFINHSRINDFELNS